MSGIAMGAPRPALLALALWWRVDRAALVPLPLPPGCFVKPGDCATRWPRTDATSNCHQREAEPTDRGGKADRTIAIARRHAGDLERDPFQTQQRESARERGRNARGPMHRWQPPSSRSEGAPVLDRQRRHRRASPTRRQQHGDNRPFADVSSISGNRRGSDSQ